MKVKVGTTLDPELYRQVQESAHLRGCSISQLIEDALRVYLRQEAIGTIDRVSESFGEYRVSPERLAEILQDDPFDG